MTDPKGPAARRIGPLTIAAALSLVWVLGVAVLLATLGSDGALWLASAVAAVLPLALVWFAALLARHSAQVSDEARRLAEAANALRNAAETVARASRSDAVPPAAPTLRLATPASDPGPRPAPATAPPEPRQESLPLAPEAPSASVPLAALIRALDFPDSAADEDGFRALRLALGDPRMRRLVQASQDVLTLLSEEGIYMDDLTPDRARPEIWRRFAGGERGHSVSAVGGIRDRSSLALSAARMRADPVFRDAAHHFLRLFDTSLAALAPEATDAELAALADTRTARAFMLVGRVAGIFE